MVEGVCDGNRLGSSDGFSDALRLGRDDEYSEGLADGSAEELKEGESVGFNDGLVLLNWEDGRKDEEFEGLIDG